MSLPLDILNQLNNLVKTSFAGNILEFENFTQANMGKLQLTYLSSVPSNSAPNDGIPIYLRKLNRSVAILSFIEALKAYMDTDHQIQSFCDNILINYELHNHKWRRKKELYKRFLIKNKLPFIDRESFKDRFYKVLEEEANKVIWIKGERKSGITYIGWYLVEISSTIKCFDFFEVNLKTISLEHSDQLVTAAIVAENIASRFGLNLPDDASSFKIQPFVNQFRSIVKDIEHPVLIYIDQFDVPLSEDAKALVFALAKVMLQGDLPCLLVIAGFQDVDSWEPTVRHLIERVDLKTGCFEKAHIDSFIDGVFQYFAQKYPVFNDRVAFQQLFDKVLEGEKFNGTPNVVSIGTKVTELFDEIYENV